MQGGMIELPIPTFPTGVMRGRFIPHDGQLYLCGMFAWAGNATLARRPLSHARHRQADAPADGLHATKTGLKLTFTEPLDPASTRREEHPDQDLVAQADRQLRLEALRRTAAGSPRRHAVRRRQDAARSTSPTCARPGAWRSNTPSAPPAANRFRARFTTRFTVSVKRFRSYYSTTSSASLATTTSSMLGVKPRYWQTTSLPCCRTNCNLPIKVDSISSGDDLRKTVNALGSRR